MTEPHSPIAPSVGYRVTNPFEQIRWFLGKNMTSETIPPRACCGLAHSGEPIVKGMTGAITAIDDDSDIPYWNLFKPDLYHERCQSPSCVVFNGPEPIPPGKKGRVTQDYPAAALCHAANGDGIAIGPIAGKWFLGRWRDAFRSVGITFDAGETYDLSTIVVGGSDPDPHVSTGYVVPNPKPMATIRSGVTFMTQVPGDLWEDDMPIFFAADYYTGDPEPPFQLWTREHADGDIMGWKINVPGWYSGHASAVVSFAAVPGPWSAGFVWAILAGDEIQDWYGLPWSGDPEEICYSPFVGRRALSHAGCVGTTISSAENVSVPFLGYLVPGNIVHLRATGNTLGYSNFGFGSMVFQSEIVWGSRKQGGTWQEHSHPV
jgi:hypothetical protein